MHQSSMEAMVKFFDDYLNKDSKLKILDIGSKTYHLQLNYRESISPNWDYIGLDIEEGDNVDVVATNPYSYPFEDEVFDVIISGQCVEHVQDLHKWFIEASRLLKKGGCICVITPWIFPEHSYPSDYWRVLPSGMRFLFEKIAGLKVSEIYTVWHIKPVKGDCIGIAQKI